MNRSLVLLLSAAAAAIAGGTFLARIDYAPGQNASAIAASGVAPLAEFDGWCLVRGADRQLPVLTGSGFAVTLLDNDPDQKSYYYVSRMSGRSRSLLEGCGDVLTADRSGVLLRADEAAVLELNRLPLQLCGVSMDPMVLTEPVPPPTRPVSESLVQALVDRVSADSVLAQINRLVAFYTRYSTTESCRLAARWIETKFQAYGCDSTAQEVFRSGYAPNVIGRKLGAVNPRPIWVICGHIDNTSDYAPNRCPGSDDNASGTAAVLEACRVFADIGFDQTVYFIGFSGEEQGLYGSDSFTRRASRRGDSIMAALNFDMISYGRQNRDTFEVIGRNSSPNCHWLVDSFIANANAYTNLKTRKTMLTSGGAYSDHYYFWMRGWPAFCGIERDFTPMYHTIGDTVGPLYYTNCGTNNVPMATAAIKAAVATIAKFAGAHVLTGTKEPAAPVVAQPRLSGTTIGRPPFRLQSPVLHTGSRLEVYDAMGRLLTRIYPDGTGTVIWDGLDAGHRRQPTGVYLVRVTGEHLPVARVALLD